MIDTARAFAYLAYLLSLRGRRLDRLRLMFGARVIRPEEGSSARVVAMAPRAERRRRVRELRRNAKRDRPELNRRDLREMLPFRPVYGHGIPAPDHKDVIAALATWSE